MKIMATDFVWLGFISLLNLIGGLREFRVGTGWVTQFSSLSSYSRSHLIKQTKVSKNVVTPLRASFVWVIVSLLGHRKFVNSNEFSSAFQRLIRYYQYLKTEYKGNNKNKTEANDK